MNFKRMMALLLAVCMTLAYLPGRAQAAENVQLDNSDMTVVGTNSFGTLLSNEILASQEAAASDEQAGYSVTDLTFSGSTATVTYDAAEEATLVVAVYTEDGLQLLASGKATVSPEETEATVTIEGTMPEYFYATAFLLHTEDYLPLCEEYSTPMYTREMQELLDSTVNNYDAGRVYNLDDDTTTNFAVFAEGTIVVREQDGVNTIVSADDDARIYVIENADAVITSLTQGDVLAYPHGEGEILIVKVASITVDGTTATITGSELEMEEVFEAVKIESENGTSDITVDATGADACITYEGVEETIKPRAVEDSGTAKVSHTFKIDTDSDEDDSDDDDDSDDKVEVEGKLSGSLQFSLEVSLSFYLSGSKQYLEFKVNAGVTVGGSASGKVSINAVKLGSFDCSPMAGVYIHMKPTVSVIFDGEASFSLSYSFTLGFRVQHASGSGFSAKNLSTKPKLDAELKFEGSLFIGVDMHPSISILHEDVAEASMGDLIGFQITGKMTHNFLEEISGDEETIHQCEYCLDGTIQLILKVDVGVQFLNSDRLKFDTNIVDLNFKIADFYWSVDHGDFGLGECPYLLYRVTASVVDADGALVPNAHVTIRDTHKTTNSNGVVAFYVSNGVYTITARANEMSDIQVHKVEAPCKVTLCLSGEEHRYLLVNVPMTWSEACDYCESMGGYLVTVTSAEENQTIVQLISAEGTQNCYWIGLSRPSVNSSWQWVTGEPFSYSNWAANEPNNMDNEGEVCVHAFGKLYTGGNGTKYVGDWNDASNDGAGYTATFYDINNFGFICEFGGNIAYESSEEMPTAFTGRLVIENKTAGNMTPNVAYGGETSSEDTGTYTLETASFSGLVPGAEYVMLAMRSIDAEDVLAGDNLLGILQATAKADGTLEFRYIQRVDSEESYVLACGPSGKNLRDATITFPKMVASEELQAVNPIVIYSGEVLVEGVDYVITGTVDFIHPGKYTCQIQGIHNYTGTVTCTYTVLDGNALLGDVNDDGEIDILDANVVVTYYNEIIDLTEEQLHAADVNGDGEVDIMDANMIVAYYNEAIDAFPAK